MPNFGLFATGFFTLFSGFSLAVMLGLVVGKFLGVFSFSWLTVRLKWVSLPAGASWKSFASVCMVCGIGFTVSMFIAFVEKFALSKWFAKKKFGVKMSKYSE